MFRTAVTVAGALLAAVILPIGVTPTAAAADCGAGYVGLTYDDGPLGATTTQLLTALRSAGVRATFFDVGTKVQQNPALARSQVDAGMWVGNHSWTHPHLTQLSASQITSELSQTQQALRQATGQTPRLFRPPYGETNGTLRSIEAQQGLTEVLWTVDSQDWNGASTSQIVQAAGQLQNGGVILMHDGYQTTINAIPQIVANLTSRGLCAGMISPTTGQAVAPTGTPPPTGATCAATYRTTQQWGDRFNGEVTITAGATAITGWTATVTVTVPQKITTTWNGAPTWNAGGNVMTMKPNGNGALAPGASTTFGFTVMTNGQWATPTTSCRTA